MTNREEKIPVWWTPVFVFLLEGDAIYYKNIKLNKGTVALVLSVMYYFASMHKGVCSASIATISKKTGAGVKTVERSIHALEEMKFILDLTPTRRHVTHNYRILTYNIRKAHISWYNNSPYKNKKVASVEDAGSVIETPVQIAPASPEKVSSSIRRMKRMVRTNAEED